MIGRTMKNTANLIRLNGKNSLLITVDSLIERWVTLFNDLILTIIKITGKHFNDVIIGIIIVLAVFWFIKYDIIILYGLSRNFKKITPDLNAIEFNILDGLNKVNNLFEEQAHGALKKLWKNYYDEVRSSEGDEKNPDLGEYFSSGLMITIPACHKKTEIVPTILVGIGIMGTILGIAAELESMLIPSAETALYSDQQFFSLIISASGISILGIALALIFQYIDNQLYHKVVTEAGFFIDTLRRKIPVPKTDVNLHILLKEQRIQAARLQKTIENFGGNISSHIVDSLVPAISNAVDNFVINMTAALSGQLQALGESVRNSRENLEFLIAELAKTNEDQRKINSDCGLITGTIVQYHADIVKCNENLAESLEKLNHFSGTLSETAGRSRDLLQNIVDQQLNIQQENSNYITCMSNNLEGSLNHAVEGIAKNVEEMLEHLDTQVRNAGVYTKEINDGIGELNWRLGDAVREFNDQVHGGLERTFNDFDTGLCEICMRLSGTITQIKDSIDDLPVVFSGLKNSVTVSGENDI